MLLFNFVQCWIHFWTNLELFLTYFALWSSGGHLGRPEGHLKFLHQVIRFGLDLEWILGGFGKHFASFLGTHGGQEIRFVDRLLFLIFYILAGCSSTGLNALSL